MKLARTPPVERFAVILGHNSETFHIFYVQEDKPGEVLVAHSVGEDERGGMMFVRSARTQRPLATSDIDLKFLVRDDQLAGVWVNGEAVDVTAEPGRPELQRTFVGSFGFNLQMSQIKVKKMSWNGIDVDF